MSEAEFHKLQDSNPNLHKDVQNGHLTEANGDFVKVAERYPLHEKK